ncbi:uncharacterized protein LOC129263626 isoform X2 [Lytechinus pictus]|uniref:uncharacterized protein LOC129263626 isoform X2 n=1 Tax=Lytechinus pictus TaxID=7653 RepID=UPI0030BA200C
MSSGYERFNNEDVEKTGEVLNAPAYPVQQFPPQYTGQQPATLALGQIPQVKNRAAGGDYNGATISSSEARRWSWAGCIIGGITWGIALLVTCVYIGLAVAACNAGDCYNY